MSSKDTRKAMLMAWAALALAAFAWFVSQQVGSNLSFADCDSNGALQTGLIGLLALALTAAGAFLSWRVWKGNEPEGRAFAALAGVLTAALLALAIVWQTVAALIVPSCYA